MSELTVRRHRTFPDTARRFLRNKAALIGLGIILIMLFCALFPEWIAPYGYDDQDLSQLFIAPCREHWFGTDNFGRDIFSRVVYGCRTSLLIGVCAVGIACLIGVFIGSIAGYFAGRVDNVLMRLMDIMLAIPNILLAMSIVAALGTGTFNLILAIGIGSIPGYARVVRASILSVREQEYIEAARSIGAGHFRIIRKHILPNCMAPIIVQATMSVATAILSTAGLSFIGITPPTAEWGSMLASGRAYLRDYWFVVTFPGLAIMISVFAFNLFGDGLRDTLDPKLRS